METTAPNVFLSTLFLFKSYYVVWKPWTKPQHTRYPLWFKSYYVVWKLYITCVIYVIHNTFKSYYVVWKLQKRGRTQQLPPGLNRTMQYGNLKSTKMQRKIYASLNRTMQYGNQFVGYNPSSHSHRFKSYYVVWKRARASAIASPLYLV